MHWIDPNSLPVLDGEVERFIIYPRGDLDGLVLVGGQLVHFPPHLSQAVAAAIRPGDRIGVHGIRPRGAAMIAAVSLTSATGEVILDEGPDAGEKTHEGEHDKRERQELEAHGKVRLSLFGPKGELRGALLDDGTVLRVPPKEARQFENLLRPQASLAARGKGFETKHGRVVEAKEIGPDLANLTSVKEAKAKKEKPIS